MSIVKNHCIQFMSVEVHWGCRWKDDSNDEGKEEVKERRMKKIGAATSKLIFKTPIFFKKKGQTNTMIRTTFSWALIFWPMR